MPGPLLGWLLDGAVGAEGLQLLLDTGQGVGKLAAVQDSDGLLDPGKQVRGQPTVLLNQVPSLARGLDPTGCNSEPVCHSHLTAYHNR